MPAPPEPNYVTFVGPVALLPPAVLHNSFQTYQPANNAPLAGKIAWQLAPGIFSATIEVSDGRSAQGGVTSAAQRTLIGVGDGGASPGSKGVADFPVYLGPYSVGGRGYTQYLVVLSTRLKWTDQWGNEQAADGLGYAAFIVQ